MKTAHANNLHPRHWNGQASLAKENLLRNNLDEFTKTIPLTEQGIWIYELGREAFKGAKFQAFVKGRCEQITEWDISGAYGAVLSSLPDIKFGSWHEVYDVSPNCFYGVYRVKHEWDGFQHYKSKSGRVYYPITAKGELVTDTVTKPEIEWLKRRGLKVEILFGYEFWHDSDKRELARLPLARYPPSLESSLSRHFATLKRLPNCSMTSGFIAERRT